MKLIVKKFGKGGEEMSFEKQEYDRRMERTIKTINREETDRVPFMIVADGYAADYLGVDVNDVTTYEKAIEINRKFYEDIQYDVLVYPFTPANVFNAQIEKALGGGCHSVVKGYKQVNPQEVKILDPKEYPELIKNPTEYLLEIVFPKRFSMLRIEDPEEKFEKLKEVMGIFGAIGEYVHSYEKNGIPLLKSVGSIYPVDFIMDVLRDFSGISGDIRRYPELVRDAGLAMVEAYKSMFSTVPPGTVISAAMHLPPYIKPKDFEKVYWPSYKAIIEDLVGKGYNLLFAFEKNYSHLYDYLQELPKGIVGIFEEDDIRVVKKKLGSKMAIAGGLRANILKNGSKAECIDHVKGLIDDLGPGGGYFITNDMPMCFPHDVKPENLKAVADYINKQ